jgi:hypothetical protein
VSLVGATTPLVQGTGSARKYRYALLAHTAGSVIAGAAAGASVGLIGHLGLGESAMTGRAAAVAGIGIALGLQQVGLLGLPTLQMSRQTSKQWREALGAVGAATAWGIDLGSGLTTYVIYAAYWLLPIAAVARGDVIYGVVLLGVFGCARALSVVAASLMSRDAARVPLIGEGTPFHGVLIALSGHANEFRRAHGWGIVAVCAAALVHLAM